MIMMADTIVRTEPMMCMYLSLILKRWLMSMMKMKKIRIFIVTAMVNGYLNMRWIICGVGCCFVLNFVHSLSHQLKSFRDAKQDCIYFNGESIFKMRNHCEGRRKLLDLPGGHANIFWPPPTSVKNSSLSPEFK